MTPNIKQMVADYLKANGYDGLYNTIGSEGCGCEIGELFPCSDINVSCEECRAGYKHPAPEMTGYDFIIGPEKGPNQ